MKISPFTTVILLFALTGCSMIIGPDFDRSDETTDSDTSAIQRSDASIQPQGEGGTESRTDSSNQTDTGSSVDGGMGADKDAGKDARMDAGTDSSMDSSIDSGSDTGTDAELDAQEDTAERPPDADVDCGIDSGVDAEVDSGIDSGVDAEVDSGIDSGVDAEAGSGTETGVEAVEASGALNPCQELEYTAIDNRFDIAEVDGDSVRRWSESVALLVDKTEGLDCTDNHCTLAVHPYQTWNEYPLCDTTSFYGQEQAAYGHCAATLVGPDLFVTAGHCLRDVNDPLNPTGVYIPDCFEIAVIFGFQVDDAGVVHTEIPANDIYQCSEIVARQYHQPYGGAEDWTVFRVERYVFDRSPIPIRHSGSMTDGTDIAVLGHGRNLPLKIDINGKVLLDDANEAKFFSNASLYGDYGGGPAIDLITGVVEGISSTHPAFLFEEQVGSGCYLESLPEDVLECSELSSFDNINHSASEHIPLEPASAITVASDFLY